jgi:hypothetical protein
LRKIDHTILPIRKKACPAIAEQAQSVDKRRIQPREVWRAKALHIHSGIGGFADERSAKIGS